MNFSNPLKIENKTPDIPSIMHKGKQVGDETF